MSGKAKDLLQMDLYGLLDIESTATTKEVCELANSSLSKMIYDMNDHTVSLLVVIPITGCEMLFIRVFTGRRRLCFEEEAVRLLRHLVQLHEKLRKAACVRYLCLLLITLNAKR